MCGSTNPVVCWAQTASTSRGVWSEETAITDRPTVHHYSYSLIQKLYINSIVYLLNQTY